MGTGSACHLQKLLNMIKNIEKTQEISNMLGVPSGEINKVSLHDKDCMCEMCVQCVKCV